jgi:hypothetical protein
MKYSLSHKKYNPNNIWKKMSQKVQFYIIDLITCLIKSACKNLLHVAKK